MSADFSSLGVAPAEIEAIVRTCSRWSLRYFRSGPIDIDNKWSDGFDPVTAADRLVERELREQLAAAVGELPVIGEEEGTTGDPTTGFAWIIDPIDGTRAFISGQPQWGTLLGLLHDGAPFGGWMYLPVLDEFYWAVRDDSHHSLPTSESRSTSGCTTIAGATLACTHPTSMFHDHDAVLFDSLEASVRLSRFGGDCHNYGLLANGDIDLVVENQMQSYDILPLVPIVEAAGGVVTDRNGNPPLEGGMIIAAGTAELHAAALAHMNS